MGTQEILDNAVQLFAQFGLDAMLQAVMIVLVMVVIVKIIFKD